MESRTADGLVVGYLKTHSPEFSKLAAIRQKGWESAAGDAYFSKQRRKADANDPKKETYFWHLMQSIGRELQQHTGAFTCKNVPRKDCRIVDFCTAPGGFLRVALQKNSKAEAIAFTLPEVQGGHKVLLPSDERVSVKEIDITMLAEDMGVNTNPAFHPDLARFLPRQFDEQDLCDLAICDGQVLRTHERAEYRELREATRLIVTQLALALEHIKPGGTMIALLHKVEAWRTVSLLHRLCQYATVRLYKPTKSHTTRSSFYLVATDIQTDHAHCGQMVAEMKKIWKIATFGTDQEYAEAMRGDEGLAEQVLQVFGPRLVEMGKDVWATQEAALAQASWNQ